MRGLKHPNFLHVLIFRIYSFFLVEGEQPSRLASAASRIVNTRHFMVHIGLKIKGWPKRLRRESFLAGSSDNTDNTDSVLSKKTYEWFGFTCSLQHL